MLYLDEVGRWETTGHCSPEIQCNAVYLEYPAVLSQPTSANRRRGGPAEMSLKILSATLDNHFTFGPYARDCVERAARALNVMKILAGSSWDFTTKSLVLLY